MLDAPSSTHGVSLLIYLSAAACISGGTTFGRLLAQEYLEGQSCKKKSLENSKNRQIITFTLALVYAIHQSMLSR